MTTCPNRHESHASDFCTVCGIEMTPAGPPPAEPEPAATGSDEECPTCRAKRAGGGDFCEVCGYNFKTGVCGIPFAHEPAPAAEAPPAEPAPVPAETDADTPSHATAPLTTPAPALRWQLVASIDLSDGKIPESEAPADRAERIFPLDLDDQLIGRRSARRGVNPEIGIENDDGISHRHARILRQPDGSFSILDLGSSNGTLLNGKEIKANVLTPLQEGDSIGLGRWTRLAFRPRG